MSKQTIKMGATISDLIHKLTTANEEIARLQRKAHNDARAADLANAFTYTANYLRSIEHCLVHDDALVCGGTKEVDGVSKQFVTSMRELRQLAVSIRLILEQPQ